MGKGIKKYFIFIINCLILLLSGNFAYSQSVISGKVKDTLQNPVSFANVFLKAKNQNGILAFTTTAENGDYKLMTDKVGEFEVSFSSISFQKKSETVLLEKGKNLILNVILKYETFSLNEVIINTDKAITIKKDTVIFKADAFKRGNEETVEDLLKNIPGIEVADDGKIKIGGKEIEKVMVEGDDLFKKGYALLTKNLDASVINTVEVYDKYSNNKLLKGIEDSDRVALNLTLKNNVKNRLFATLKPGYGFASENSYDASANIISFRKQNKFYGFTSLNNIGLESTVALSEMLADNEQSFGDEDTNQEAKAFINLLNYKPEIGDERTNFNNAEMVSLNNIYSISDKVNLKTIGFLNWDENKFFRNSFDTFFLPIENFTTTEDYNLFRKTFAGFLNTELTYDISKKELFEYSGKYSGSKYNTDTNLVFNEQNSAESLGENPFTIQQNFKYTNKLKANQALLVNGYYLNSSNPQNYNNNRFLFNDLFSTENNVSEIRQFSKNSLYSFGADVGLLTKRANSDSWNVGAGFNYNNNKYNSVFQLEVVSENPQGFQNNSTYENFSIFFEPSYKIDFGTLGLTGNIRFAKYFTELKTENSILNNSPLFINPKITANWKINKTNRILSFISYERKNPTLQNVQNEFVLAQYNTFSKGLQNIDPLDTSTFLINYTLGTILSKFYMNTTFIYSNNNEYLGTKSEVTPNYNLNELIRFEDKTFVNISTDINYFLNSISSNAKLKFGYNRQNFENIINDNLRNVEASTFNYGGEFRTAFTGALNFHIGTQWFRSKFETTIAQKNTRNRTFLDVVFEPIKNLNLSLNSSRYSFSQLDQKENSYYFMDFEGRFQILKNKVSVSLVGKNLLNTRTFRDVSVSDIGVFQTEYKLLPRFILLKANIRL